MGEGASEGLGPEREEGQLVARWVRKGRDRVLKKMGGDWTGEFFITIV